MKDSLEYRLKEEKKTRKKFIDETVKEYLLANQDKTSFPNMEKDFLLHAGAKHYLKENRTEKITLKFSEENCSLLDDCMQKTGYKVYSIILQAIAEKLNYQVEEQRFIQPQERMERIDIELEYELKEMEKLIRFLNDKYFFSIFEIKVVYNSKKSFGRWPLKVQEECVKKEGKEIRFYCFQITEDLYKFNIISIAEIILKKFIILYAERYAIKIKRGESPGGYLNTFYRLARECDLISGEEKKLENLKLTEEAQESLIKSIKGIRLEELFIEKELCRRKQQQKDDWYFYYCNKCGLEIEASQPIVVMCPNCNKKMIGIRKIRK